MRSSYLLGLCYGGMVTVAIGVNLLPVYFTTFSSDFGGLNEEQLGRISAFMFAGIVMGILISGPLADRFGVRFFTTLGAAVSAAGLLLISAASDYNLLLAAGVVSGLGAGILDMIMSPIVSAVCANRRAIALNRLHAFYCLGAVGTVLAASASMYLGVSWRLVSASMAVVPLALLVGFAVVPLPPLVHPDFTRDGLRLLMRRPRFLLALAAIALIGATEAGMSQWLPAYSERDLGYDRASSGAILVAFSVAMASGRILASHRTNRLNPHVVLFVAGIICFGCYLSCTLSPIPLLALAASVLLGFACGPLWPTELAITADRFPHGGASMFALLAGSGNFGCLVMPWIIGMVAESTSLRTGLLAGSLAPLALLVILAAVWSIDHSKKAVG